MRESQRLFQRLVPEDSGVQPIFRGVTLRRRSLKFLAEDGKTQFSNVYSAEIDERECRFGMAHSPTPRHPRRFLDGLGDAVLINAGFMFTVDCSSIWPDNYTYHLQVADGKLIGLPTKSKYAIVAHAGKLRPEFVAAEGTLHVGRTLIRWIGSHEPEAGKAEVGGCAVCFGPSNQRLIKGARGIRPDASNLLIEPKKGSRLASFALNGRGDAALTRVSNEPLPYLAGVFVLRLPEKLADRLKLGAAITDWRVGQLTPRNAGDAVTSGILLSPSPEETGLRRLADRLPLTMREDGATPYYGDRDSQKGRTCVFRTIDGRVHFLIVDARPKIAGQQGMTLIELSRFLYDSYDVDWALSLDGGQSSKICWSSGDTGGVVGNLHYLNLKDSQEDWDGINGRPVTSCLIARRGA